MPAATPIAYKKLVWAADLKTLYRILDLASLTDGGAARGIRARQQAMADKIGGDSIFTVYLTLDLDKAYFRAHRQRAPVLHALHCPGFPTPACRSWSDPRPSGAGAFTADQGRIVAWLERYLDLTTYEISCPVLRDGTLAPEGQTGLIISTLFDYALTKHIQAMGWYEEFRQLVAEQHHPRARCDDLPGARGRRDRPLYLHAADAREMDGELGGRHHRMGLYQRLTSRP